MTVFFTLSDQEVDILFKNRMLIKLQSRLCLKSWLNFEQNFMRSFFCYSETCSDCNYV
jgi:hypothetical protein